MELLEKPVGDRVLHAMAQAYPDPVDPYLLSMVMACDSASLKAAMTSLVDAGLAQARVVRAGADEHLEVTFITDKGMVVADGLAADADEATAYLGKLEAQVLRQLLAHRIGASRLPQQQTEELRGSLASVSDADLVDAAKIWAHQTVSDWKAFFRVMGNGASTAS